jgi:two-component system, OmpR family, response regulator VicR
MSVRVVFIEDDPEIVHLVKIILAREDFEVIGAASGLEGLHLIEDTQPDLVLLDLMLPGMDGWEVYQRMKAHPDISNIPVIVVTAKAQNIDKVLALRVAKVDGYITKPFAPAELLESVKKVLSTRDT